MGLLVEVQQRLLLLGQLLLCVRPPLGLSLSLSLHQRPLGGRVRLPLPRCLLLLQQAGRRGAGLPAAWAAWLEGRQCCRLQVGSECSQGGTMVSAAFAAGREAASCLGSLSAGTR